MTDQDHIDAMLAKLRERIPGLEWRRLKNRLFGYCRTRGKVADCPTITYDWTGNEWVLYTDSAASYHGHSDSAVANGIDLLRTQLDMARSALKGAK